MRVVEPHQFSKLQKKRNKKRLPRQTILLPIMLFIVVVGYVAFVQTNVTAPENKQAESSSLTANQDSQEPTSEELKLREFTDEEFHELYVSFAYPNTQPLTEPPAITGNTTADERIQLLAKERGYELSAVPVSSIVKIDEPYLTEDDLLQQNAKIGWQGLKEAAGRNQIPLRITSAYRSIEFQRSVFVSRLRDAGISNSGIAEGYSDAAVERVMDQVAPPGYSRHHNGYTIDVSCDGVGLFGFKTTSCYEWISKNNFQVAKEHGWIPSYPEEATMQGPEPEPWEFIWVGTINLYE